MSGCRVPGPKMVEIRESDRVCVGNKAAKTGASESVLWQIIPYSVHTVQYRKNLIGWIFVKKRPPEAG
jgi:hypothetical protein